MSWNPLGRLGKSQPPTSSRLKSLDKKLVQTVQTHSLPRWTQIKYVSSFLNHKEKIALGIAITTFIVGILGTIGVYLSWHLQPTPKAGGTYSEALIGEPKYINPLFASANDIDADLTNLIYAGLFRFDKNQTLRPEITDHYEISTDTKNYTIYLRHDIRWSDNEPLTASDVVYTFELIQNPEIASPLISGFQGVKVEKIDDFTVRFTLKEPFAPFLSSLTLGILPEHIWGDYNPNTIHLAKNNIQPIGAGPWQFNKLLKNDGGAISSLTLSRNNYYFGQKPYFDTLQFKFFQDYPGALEALRSGTVDGLSFLPHDFNNKLNTQTFASFELQLPEYTALFFNQTNAPTLKDSNLRLALTEAIDKNKIINTTLGGSASAINSPFFPGMIGFDSNSKKIIFNLDDANSLLDKKWTRIEPEEYFKLKHDTAIKQYLSPTDKKTTPTTTTSTPEFIKMDETITQNIRLTMDASQTFYRRDKDNNILELTITTGDTSEYSAVVKDLATMWADIGVKTTIMQISPRQLIRDQIKNRTYQVLLYGEIVGGDPDPYPFWHSSQIAYPGLNLALYNNHTADTLLENARGTVDNTKRADYYSKFTDQLTTDLPAVFLYSPIHYMAINKNIKGVSLHNINSPADRYDDLVNWYTKIKLQWK
jgi:peptide/nickel transport system substrate-binding protein